MWTLKNDKGDNPSRRHNIYVSSNSGTPNYIKEFLTDLKCETDNNTTIVGDFNILLVPVDRSSRHKVNRET